MPNTWLQLGQDALKIPGLIVEIYGDLARPGVRQVGKALDSILGLGNTVLWPITWANERSRMALESNLEKYRERLAKIPEEQIVPVAPEIGVPIAEKLAYVQDSKLSDLYVTLLAKASGAQTVSQAHPSFVNVINNLSPDEALLLEYFVDGEDLQFVRAKWTDPKTRTYSFGGDLLVAREHRNRLTFPHNLPAYVSNFAGLGLVSVHHDRSVHASDVYPRIEAYWTAQLPTQFAADPTRVLSFERGVVCTTEFGKQFIAACHSRP